MSFFPDPSRPPINPLPLIFYQPKPHVGQDMRVPLGEDRRTRHRIESSLKELLTRVRHVQRHWCDRDFIRIDNTTGHLDWLLDAHSHAWLLEVHAFPDFDQSGGDEDDDEESSAGKE
ncbi:hypothetical protein MMC07_003214 [Pseudocyphellaria aurata]|nr:hypothetical protein [Pseudocyphellaria aurata]